MNEKIEIRFAIAQDRLVLIDLYFKLLQSLDRFQYNLLPTLQNAEQMVDYIFLPAATRQEAVLIAWDQDKAAGATFWTIQTSPYQERFKLAYGYGTYVEPEYQGQKLGTRLSESAKEALKNIGVQRIMGMVHFENQHSMSLSDRIGFKPTARLDVIDF